MFGVDRSRVDESHAVHANLGTIAEPQRMLGSRADALVGRAEHVGARGAKMEVVVIAGGDEEARAAHGSELRVEYFRIIDGTRSECERAHPAWATGFYAE